MSFQNTYADPMRAQAYASLEFPGCYHLAFRDLPELLAPLQAGAQALDFGCGAGRSTRFLRDLGYGVVGVDLSAAMVDLARDQDPEGTYLLVPEGNLGGLPPGRFNRILSAFTFDNIPMELKGVLFHQLGRCLAPGGRLLNLVSSESLYRMDWSSFSTCGFPGNVQAATGDLVYTVMKDVPDCRPIPDIFCAESDYLRIYREAGLVRIHAHEPLGKPDEPFQWVHELEVSPWRIDVLEQA